MNTLTIQEYQVLAKRTCISLGSLEKDLLHMRLGIFTEIGEILDIFKKELAYKKPIDVINLGEEIADVAWYLVNLATFKEQQIKNVTNFQKYFEGDDWLDCLTFTDINLQDEEYNIDDVLGLLEHISNVHNINFYECLYKNIEKLKVRYPDNFSEERALNRDVDKEKTVL